jgi:hypothetical protein
MKMSGGRTIAALSIEAAQLLRRNAALSSSGFRIVAPRTPDEILPLLASSGSVAMLVNNSIQSPDREALLGKVRALFPELLIVHVYTGGETQTEPLAHASVDASKPEHLVFALEELLHRHAKRKKA